MNKILIESQGIYNPDGSLVVTGFAKSSNAIAHYLSKNFDVNYIATDFAGLPFAYNGYTVHRGNSDYSSNEVSQHLEQYNYDAALAICEPWGIRNYKNIDSDVSKVLYTPTDGLPIDSTLTAVKDSIDLLVPMSKFGKMALESANIQCADVIPISYNAKYFKPLSSAKRNAMRAELELTDKFVINFVGRQQSRKNLMSLVVAFERFARNKSDAVLLLTITIDKHADFDILQLVNTLGIGDKVKIIQMRPGNMVSDEELANIYAASDVYLSTSASEGFNMPVLESIACGTPAIVSKYSAHIELVAGHGELIKIDHYKTLSNNINWAYVSIDDTVAKLDKLYNDRDLLAKYSKDGIEFAKQYKDAVVQPRWTDLMNNLEDVIEEVESRRDVRWMQL